ncbi:endonuclease domain-containing protein [Demequina sp.]|uniref:endonuclease domain-containing protein n=1 Tax=Demequina sp. TaxID=2050685 RepID=UPI003A8A2739
MDAHHLHTAMEREARSFDIHEITRRWSRAALRRALRGGAVTRVLPGLYAATLHAQSFTVRAHAALAWAHPQAALIGVAATANWGLCLPPEVIVVATPWGTNRECPPWLRLRRIGTIPPAYDVNGLRTVDVPWALATSYGTLPPKDRDDPIYLAVQRRMTTARDLTRACATLARMASRRAFERLVAAIRAGSMSYLETLGLREVFHTQEFDMFLRQHRVTADGRTFELDMYDAASRTAVELDGGTHATVGGRQHDITRDAILMTQGIATVRFSTRDLETRPEWCRAVVRRIVAARTRPDLRAGRAAA